MWRKIRRFYWYRRDRGLGKQTIAMAVMLLLLVIILAGAIAKSIVPQKDLRNEAEIPANTATGPAISTSPATGAAVLEEETGSKEVPSDNNKALDVDTTGLSSFLGFMSESAFEDLENQLTVLCQNRGCKSAKKLTYQQTKNRFDVTSFILLSDGSVYQCDYNLKSCAVEFSQTSYTEADIQQMKEQQLRAEQETLKKQQQEEKEKNCKNKRKHLRNVLPRKNRKRSQPKRLQRRKKVKSNHISARACGYDDINMDLIVGLPEDTMESFQETMQGVLALHPESITVHTLSLKRSARIFQDDSEPFSRDAALAGDMLDWGDAQLLQHGYAPYYLYRQSRMVGNLENTGWAKQGKRASTMSISWMKRIPYWHAVRVRSRRCGTRIPTSSNAFLISSTRMNTSAATGKCLQEKNR